MPLRIFFPATVLVALLTLALPGCSSTEETSEPVAGHARVPKEQFFDYQLTETSAGIKQWVLISDEMRKYSDQEDVELTTVMMDFFRDGTHFSVLTADSGKAHLLTKDVYTWGNVVVITDDGRRLECEELYFSNETQLIHNEVFNTFTRGNDVMTGIGLEATPDLDYIEIKRQVEAEVADEASDQRAAPRAGSRTESDLH
jgi:LPS export ABC transporter protein LptC|nr:LPS export ABC transporter periplasmic protein LptC [Candidatus Krumholzibacteria bacterium]